MVPAGHVFYASEKNAAREFPKGDGDFLLKGDLASLHRHGFRTNAAEIPQIFCSSAGIFVAVNEI